MIKNFDEIKKQLKELAEVINAFKSETVQLRMVELILRDRPENLEEVEEDEEVEDETPKAKRRKRQPKAASSDSGGGRKRSNGSGPVATLDLLLNEQFFKNPQSLSQIVAHCSSDKARIFRLSDMSGPLGRFVRDGKLKRKKNEQGQYEYSQP